MGIEIQRQLKKNEGDMKHELPVGSYRDLENLMAYDMIPYLELLRFFGHWSSNINVSLNIQNPLTSSECLWCVFWRDLGGL